MLEALKEILFVCLFSQVMIAGLFMRVSVALCSSAAFSLLMHEEQFGLHFCMIMSRLHARTWPLP